MGAIQHKPLRFVPAFPEELLACSLRAKSNDWMIIEHNEQIHAPITMYFIYLMVSHGNLLEKG